MSNTYNIGDRPRLSGTFRIASSNALFDPDVVKCIIRRPENDAGEAVETTYTYGAGPDVVRDQVGIFSIKPLLDQAGEWKYLWQGKGTFTGVGWQCFQVEDPGFASLVP